MVLSGPPSPSNTASGRIVIRRVFSWSGASQRNRPILGGLFSDDDNEPRVVSIALSTVLGVLLLAGLWRLRTGRFSETVNLSLVGVGLVVFGVFLFWLLLIPTALALLSSGSGSSSAAWSRSCARPLAPRPNRSGFNDVLTSRT